MISHEHHCIFVHIPKTAGNSVNRVFGIAWQDHKDLQRYRAELPPDVFAAYFKFAIVRNPWDRLLSDYNYQLKKSRPADSKLFVFAANGSRRGFAAWVEAVLSTSHRYAPGQWGGEVSEHIHRWSPQVDWISVDGRIAIDYVARLEHLPRDFSIVCQRLELPPVRLPHRNRRLHWHYSRYYDRTTRESVANYYARDIEEFGYEFEDLILRMRIAWPFAARIGTGEEACDPRSGNPVSVHFPAAPCRSWARASLALAAGLALLLATWTVDLSSTSESGAAPGQRPNMERVVVREMLRTTPARVSTDPLSSIVHLVHRALEFDVILLPGVMGPFNVVPIGNLAERSPATTVRRPPRVIPWRVRHENVDPDDHPRRRTPVGPAASFLRR